MRLYDVPADNLGKCLFAHEFFHLGDGDEGLLVNILVACLDSSLGDCFLVAVFAVGTRRHQFIAVPLFAVVDCSFLSVGKNVLSPFLQIVELGDDILDLVVCEQRRQPEFITGKFQLCFRSGTALDRSLAELTPTADGIFAFTAESKLGFGLEGFLRPLNECIDRDRPCADVLAPGLKDRHGNRVDIVEMVEQP